MPCRLTVVRYIRGPRNRPRSSSLLRIPRPRILDHEPYLPGTNAGYFSSNEMLPGQLGRTVPRRLGIYPLSWAVRYERFCERSEPALRAELKRMKEHGLEFWESPRAAALYSTVPEQEQLAPAGDPEAVAHSARDKPSPPPSPPSTSRRTPSRKPARPTGFFIRPASTSSIRRPPAVNSPFIFPAGSTSSFSSVAERRVDELRSKVGVDTEIDLKQIMADLRDLELLGLWRNVKPKSAVGFKDATRALYPLFQKFDVGESKRVTLADLEDALAPDFTLPWTSIGERLLDGRVHRLTGLGAKDKAALLFLQVYNVGPTRAEKYYNAGCRTLADLVKRQDEIKLNKAQKIGLRHREDIQRLIPRAEVEKLQAALEKAVATVDSRLECEVLGSYCRGVDFSSDIDFAVRHPDFQDKDDEEKSKAFMGKIVAELEKQKLVSKDDQLMFGGKKYAGLIRLPRHKSFRRIDIRLAPYHSYHYMLLGSSGDAMLMKLLRHTAKRKGWCLNEYGLDEAYSAEDQNPNGFKPGTLKLVNSEREIFDLLGMPYLDPKERELKVWRDKYAKAGVAAVEYLHKL
ncbi:hypothetical protein JCM9279_000009 [Rhodotorula babjevae]